MSYRNQLKFGWDNEDDTTGGFVPLLNQQKLYRQKMDTLLADKIE